MIFVFAVLTTSKLVEQQSPAMQSTGASQRTGQVETSNRADIVGAAKL